MEPFRVDPTCEVTVTRIYLLLLWVIDKTRVSVL